MKRVSSRVLAFLLALTVVTTSVELPVMATEVNTEVVETEVVETEVVETEVVETEVIETEVVTITLRIGHLDGGVFKYYVHNFGARNYTDLSNSGAVVRVYKGNDLLQTYSVPQNQQGYDWFVFDITENGLVAVNEIK